MLWKVSADFPDYVTRGGNQVPVSAAAASIKQTCHCWNGNADLACHCVPLLLQRVRVIVVDNSFYPPRAFHLYLFAQNRDRALAVRNLSGCKSKELFCTCTWCLRFSLSSHELEPAPACKSCCRD